MGLERTVKLQKEVNSILAIAPDSQVFLHDTYQLMKQQIPSYSYASFARRCKFSSRSFARQLLTGEKRLTLRSLPQVVQGLKLNLGAAKLLEFMVKIENEQDVLSREQLQIKLQKYRQSFERRLTPKPIDDWEQSVFLHPQWPYVYASLNNQSHRSTKEIAKIAKLPLELTTKILQSMLDAGMIREQDELFFTEQEYLELNNMVESDFSKKFFLQELERAKQKAQKCFGADASCYFSSVITISKKNFSRFSTEFQELINRYNHDIEEPKGDTLVAITAAFTEH